jgi:hypothetical protein
MKTAMKALFGALALVILAKVIRWLSEDSQPELTTGPTHVVGTCEGCGEYVLPDQPHTYMDHVTRPAHASCVSFVAPSDAN